MSAALRHLFTTALCALLAFGSIAPTWANMANNINAALTNGLSPYAAQQIKQATGDNKAANLAAHALWGALSAHASGNNALSGAAGAATAEVMAPLIINAFNWDSKNLTEEQKQTVSALSTVAAGLAGGITGDSTANATQGAQSGYNAVNFNYLNAEDKVRKDVLDAKQQAGLLTPKEAQEQAELNSKNLQSVLSTRPKQDVLPKKSYFWVASGQ